MICFSYLTNIKVLTPAIYKTKKARNHKAILSESVTV